jgi:gliding motility-associated-like protein
MHANRNTNTRFSLLLSLLALGLFGAIRVHAQTQIVNTILPPDTMVCAPQGVFQIPATYPNSITVPAGSVNGIGYMTQTIPFQPGASAGTNVNLIDDASGGPFNIGFNFNYFGTNYNQFYISANGYISFEQPPGTYSFDATEMDTDPCGNTNYPDNAIFAWYQDFNPGGVAGSIQYQVTGTAPNRILTVYWNNIPFWGGSCAGNSTFYLRIYETTNQIQVHIQNKPQCLGMWQGDGLTGLGNPCPINATNSTCPTYSYAGSDVAQNNVAWQYTPFTPGSGAPITASVSSVTWTGLQGAGNTTFAVTGTNTSASASLLTATQAPRRYIIHVTYDVPCANDVVWVDTFVVRLRNYNANFTVQSPICQGNTSTIQFTGTPTPSASATLAWNFGTGATPATANTIGPHNVSWSSTGQKTVTFNITGGGCLPASHTETVDVVPSPTSTFTVAPATVCGNAPVTVTYTGNAPANATYTWNFDGGTATPANGAGPFSVTWSTPGVKTIRLTVAVGTCVSSETTQTVTVNPPPTSTFTVPVGGVCVGNNITLTYTGSATASAVYTWNYAGGNVVSGSGAGPISLNWSTAGTMNVTLQVNDNGCISNTTTVPVTVHPAPTASFTAPTALCPGQNGTFTFNGTAAAGATYTWSWDGGTIASGTGAGPYSVNWATAGTKNVTLSVVSAQGCASTVFSQNVTVNPTPTATFSTTPSGACVGADITLQHTGTAPAGATFIWGFADGTANPGGQASATQDINFPSAGNRNITLQVVAAGCSSSVVTNAITIYPTPTATFSVPANVCPGDVINTTYSGTGTAAATYQWTLSGATVTGNTATSGPLGLSWNTSGNKTVSLIVTENGCASPAYSQNVNVYVTPTSSFTALSPVCVGTPSDITYTGNAGSSATYNWSFNAANPTTATGQGPHTASWTIAGTYFLSLSVTENGCASQPTQVQVVVNPIPTSSFTATSTVCLGDTAVVQYTGNAPVTALFNWDFGGGISPFQVGPGPFDVKWLTPGTKTLTLSVNSLGCQSPVTTHTVEVLPLPLVDAGLNQQSCSGASVTLGGTPNPAYTYSWSPSTGVNDVFSGQTLVSRQNNLNQPIEFTYVLTANDGQCINRDTVLYTVTAPPFVSFASPPGQCLGGNTYNFQAEGFFSASSDFIWSFGPNANIPSSGVINPQNINFTTTGPQTITLQVNDGGCLSNLYTSSVIIYPDPEVNFSAEVVADCAPLKVGFNNLSVVPANTQYTWYFGDGGVSNSPEPGYVYESSGLFDVSLVATTQHGCSASMDRKEYIEVYPVPKAYFAFSASELDIISPELTVTAYTNAADSVWYFMNDVDTLLGPNHQLTFQDTGWYTFVQYVKNDFGCIDSTVREIRVNPGYRIYIPNSFSPNRDGINDVFKVYGEELSNFSIMVFNRWGQQIYMSYDMENGWDGTTQLSDKSVDQGVYVYVIRVTDDQGFEHKFEGSVNVIR